MSISDILSSILSLYKCSQRIFNYSEIQINSFTLHKVINILYAWLTLPCHHIQELTNFQKQSVLGPPHIYEKLSAHKKIAICTKITATG